MTEVEMKKQNLKNELIDAIYTFLNTGDTDNFDDALYDASEGLSDNDIVNDEKVANAVRDLNKEIIYQTNSNVVNNPFPNASDLENEDNCYAFGILMNLPGAKLLLTDKQVKLVKQAVNEFVEECKWQFDEHVFSKIAVNGFDYDNVDDIEDYLSNAYF